MANLLALSWIHNTFNDYETKIQEASPLNSHVRCQSCKTLASTSSNTQQKGVTERLTYHTAYSWHVTYGVRKQNQLHLSGVDLIVIIKVFFHDFYHLLRKARNLKVRRVRGEFGLTYWTAALFLFDTFIVGLNGNTADWHTGWLPDWLNGSTADWQPGWLPVWLNGSKAAWQTGRLAVWLTARLADWKTDWLAVWQPGSLTNWPRADNTFLIDTMNDQLTDWRIARLTAWQERKMTDSSVNGKLKAANALIYWFN